MVTFCRDMQVPVWTVPDVVASWRVLAIGLGRFRGWAEVERRIGFELTIQERAILLSQRANRLAAKIIITSTNDAAQASEFWAS